MSITVQIPSPLRHFTDDQAEVSVEAGTVGDAMTRLVEQHTDLRPHLYDDEGQLRSFVNLFLNEEDVRYLEKEATALAAGDRLTIETPGGGGWGAPADAVPDLVQANRSEEQA